MPKKQSSKQRTKVKALPKKSKKLAGKDMKKVKGGGIDYLAGIQGIKGETELQSSKPRRT